MRYRTQLLGVVAVAALLLTGCGNAASHSAHDASPSKSASAGSTGNGMNMTDEQMAAMDQGAAGPSSSAKMICGNETRDAVKTLLKLPRTPRPTDGWAHGTYTCTYDLAIGKLVLSVQDEMNQASGRRYFDNLRHELGNTTRLGGMEGLGLPAFETKDGNVVFLKDGKTLQVDATRLPSKLPSTGSTPTDLAYTVATDVIACWSE
jgi:hypothetical protein